MARKRKPANDADREIRRLLKRHACPKPFHAVRAYLLGGIASPKLETHPLRAIAALWGGELPEFESEDEVNELLQALMQGLWNRLTRHQSRTKPFRLTPLPPPATNDDVRRFAATRVEELEAFVDGLFGGDEALQLPESAHEAMKKLADLRSFLAAFVQFSDDHETPADREKTVRNMQQLSVIAAAEINTAVQGCARARRAAL